MPTIDDESAVRLLVAIFAQAARDAVAGCGRQTGSLAWWVKQLAADVDRRRRNVYPTRSCLTPRQRGACLWKGGRGETMHADDWELCHENDITNAYRRLFLAVVAQAVKDAANGDLVAVAFVNEWGLTHCLAHVKRRKRRKVAA